jgi:hypothetical protein
MWGRLDFVPVLFLAIGIYSWRGFAPGRPILFHRRNLDLKFITVVIISLVSGALVVIGHTPSFLSLGRRFGWCSRLRSCRCSVPDWRSSLGLLSPRD